MYERVERFIILVFNEGKFDKKTVRSPAGFRRSKGREIRRFSLFLASLVPRRFWPTTGSESMCVYIYIDVSIHVYMYTRAAYARQRRVSTRMGGSHDFVPRLFVDRWYLPPKTGIFRTTLYSLLSLSSCLFPSSTSRFIFVLFVRCFANTYPLIINLGFPSLVLLLPVDCVLFFFRLWLRPRVTAAARPSHDEVTTFKDRSFNSRTIAHLLSFCVCMCLCVCSVTVYAETSISTFNPFVSKRSHGALVNVALNAKRLPTIEIA